MKHLEPKEAHDYVQYNLDAARVGDVINVEGVESPLDERYQRSRLSGGRKEGLPWEQT
jgi:hypothetical protein